MSNKFDKALVADLLEHPDKYTTAERSLINSGSIKGLETIVENIIVGNSVFGDESLTLTQATRAEDIVSEEDKRLQEEIDTIGESITGIQGDVETIQGNITTIQGNITTIQGEQNTQNGRLDELESDVETIENVNANQSNRLTVLEQNQIAIASDYSTYTKSGNVSTTVQNFNNPTIVRDFESSVGINNIDTVTLDHSVTVSQGSIVDVIFSVDVNQVTGSLVDYTIELYNITKGEVMDTTTMTIDFSPNSSWESGERSLIGRVDAGDVIQIRSYTDVGTVLVDSKGIIKINATTGGSEVYDNQVLSTNEELGNETVDQDIKTINDKLNEIYAQIEVD